MFFVIEVDNDGFKVFDSAGNAIDPAKDASVTALGTLLTAIKDTDGIKKIVDALPAGSNSIGKIGDLEKWLGSAAPTVGQKAMAASIPVVMASDQPAISTSTQGILEQVSAGKIFCAALQANSGNSGVDTPMLYLKNPTGSGKSLYVWKIQAGTSITNTSVIFKVFKNPTITVDGTSLTIVNRYIGSGATSIANAFSKPTASSNGTLMSALTQGQNSNALIFADDYSIKVDPGNSIIVTASPSSNIREMLVTAIWMEQ